MLSIPQAKRCFELFPCSELRFDLRWRVNNQQLLNNNNQQQQNQITPSNALPILTVKIEPRNNTPIVADWFGFVTNTDTTQLAKRNNENDEDSAMTFRIGCTNHSSSTCLFSPSGCFVTVEGPAQIVQKSINVFNFIDVDRHSSSSSTTTSSSTPQWPLWRKQVLHLHNILQSQRVAAMERGKLASYDDIEARLGPRIMVCSSRAGCGKTTICKMLLNLAVRDGFQPLFVSADPSGTSLVGQPGCFSAFYADSGIDPTENSPTNGSANYYPCVQVVVPVDGCTRTKRAEAWGFALNSLMMKQAEKRTMKLSSCASGGVIVDTETVDEFLSPDDLDKLVAVIDQCNIQYVVVVGSENLRNSLRLKLSGLLHVDPTASDGTGGSGGQPVDDGISPIVINTTSSSAALNNEVEERKRRERERAMRNLMLTLNSNSAASGGVSSNNKSSSTNEQQQQDLDPETLLLQEQMKRFSQVPVLSLNNSSSSAAAGINSTKETNDLDVCDVIKNESTPNSILRKQTAAKNNEDPDDDEEEEIRVTLINFPIVDGAEDTSSSNATSWVFSPLIDGNNPQLTANNRALPSHQPQLQIPAIIASWNTYFFGTATSPLSAFSITKVLVASASSMYSASSTSNNNGNSAKFWCSMKAVSSNAGGGIMPLLDSGVEQQSSFRSVAEPIDIVAKFEQFTADFKASKAKNTNKGGKNQRPMMMAALVRSSSSTKSSSAMMNPNLIFDASVGNEVIGFVGIVNAGTLENTNASSSSGENQQFVDILSPMKSLPMKESFVFALLHGDWQP